MFSFIRDLRQFCQTYNLSLQDIWEISNQYLDAGFPPEPGRKEELRKWLADVLVATMTVTEKTSIKWDDKTVFMVKRVVTDDGAWDIFYDLFMLVYNHVADASSSEMVSAVPNKAEELVGATESDMDFDDIMQLILELIDLFNSYFSERNGQ